MTDILYAQGTTYEFGTSTGDYDMTTASLAAGSGRQSDQHDAGSADRAIRMRLEGFLKFGAAPTVGDGVEIHVFGYNDTAKRPAGLGATDAALGGTNDERLRDSLVSMTIEAWSTSTSDEFSKAIEFESSCRYFIIVIYNRTGNSALSSTENDCLVRLTAVNPQIQ